MEANKANEEPALSVESREVRIADAGMRLFIVSLSILFAALLAGVIVVRLRAEDWIPPDAPPLPWALWVSTVLILLASLSIQLALSKIRAGDQSGLFRYLIITTALGVLFLAVQGYNWSVLVSSGMTPGTRSLFSFTFYVLTGLHALHILGGLVPLGILTRNARRGLYTRESHSGVTHTATYWHFLDVVWIVMFIMLLISS